MSSTRKDGDVSVGHKATGRWQRGWEIPGDGISPTVCPPLLLMGLHLGSTIASCVSYLISLNLFLYL